MASEKQSGELRVGDDPVLAATFRDVLVHGLMLSGGGLADLMAAAWGMAPVPGGPLLDEYIHRSPVRVADGRQWEA